MRMVWLVLLHILMVVLNHTYAQYDEKLFEVAKYYGNKEAAISYTFDDGLEEHFTLVYPKFQELGFKGTFWINGKAVNEAERGIQKKTPRVLWNDLKVMAKSGHEISNHGWSHKNLTKISIDEACTEITRNDSIIFSKTGIKPVTYCYAYNSKNDTIIKLASQGRVATRTTQVAMGHESTNENLNCLIEKVIENKEWRVMMIHGITYGWDAFTDANILWQHLDFVKQKTDKIWVATFKDIAAYTAEKKNTQLRVHKKRRKWIIIPQSNLDENLFSHKLTMIVNQDSIKQFAVKQNGKNIPLYYRENTALFDFNPNEKIVVKIK